MRTHQFYRWVFDGLWAGRWRCANCGLKVPTAAARQLEGMPCG